MKKLILIVLAVASISCAGQEIRLAVELPCPAPLVLPGLPDALLPALDAMDVELYKALSKIHELQKARRATLQAICRSTHDNI